MALKRGKPNTECKRLEVGAKQVLIHFGTNSDDKQLSSCSAWAISTDHLHP